MFVLRLAAAAVWEKKEKSLSFSYLFFPIYLIMCVVVFHIPFELRNIILKCVCKFSTQNQDRKRKENDRKIKLGKKE